MQPDRANRVLAMIKGVTKLYRSRLSDLGSTLQKQSDKATTYT